MFRNLLTIYQYLASKKDPQRLLLVVNAKYATFRELKLFGLFFGLKIPALFNVNKEIKIY